MSNSRRKTNSTMPRSFLDLSQVSKRNETVVYERSRGKYLAVLW